MPDGTTVAGRPARRLGTAATHLVLAAGAVVMVGPFVWQFLTSLKTFSETTHVPLTFLPSEWQWSNYSQVFDVLPFRQMFLTTVLMTAGRTIAQLVFCSLAAYAFARLRFRGNNLLFGLFLSVLMVPGQLFLIPQYLIVQDLGWVNTLAGLIVPGMFSAFGTFLLRQFFLALPRDVEEAARLDGANPLQIFFRIALPLARPGLLALTILTVLWSWNDLMYPLVVSTDPAAMPLSAGLATLQGEHMTDYSLLMAGSIMATVPMIVAFVVLQRHFIQGIAHTGSKS
ncbi:carbohydrate ABC transporter permease [Nonomuraea pusilla]|uniref:Multiple sugar transport system permease protein n=1 Tax=Nonomuraea pusilla TaxID=46177 RepID=A0A1H8JZA5_9ACTN|nr:carbohydrate ABC transporter permease [Nonomuraea pusilla]SEN86033.1 multiple sugar transport system permease protein [Nonomuraea pusilla]